MDVREAYKKTRRELGCSEETAATLTVAEILNSHSEILEAMASVLEGIEQDVCLTRDVLEKAHGVRP